jgi:hypothetical protein
LLALALALPPPPPGELVHVDMGLWWRYDHGCEGNRAWFRFAFKWTDQKTGKPQSGAGMQSYRTEGGKLVETWLSMQPLGSSWSDAAAQEHWTSPPPIK